MKKTFTDLFQMVVGGVIFESLRQRRCDGAPVADRSKYSFAARAG